LAYTLKEEDDDDDDDIIHRYYMLWRRHHKAGGSLYPILAVPGKNFSVACFCVAFCICRCPERESGRPTYSLQWIRSPDRWYWGS